MKEPNGISFKFWPGSPKRTHHPIHSLSWFAWWDWGWARSNLDDELAATTAGRSGWWESGQSVNDWEFLFCFQRSKSNGTGSHCGSESLWIPVNSGERNSSLKASTFVLNSRARCVELGFQLGPHLAELGKWKGNFPWKLYDTVSVKKSFSSKCDVLVSFALTKRWWWCRRPSCPLWLHAAAECQLASGGPCIEGSCAVRRTTAVDVSVGACEPFPLCPLWLADVLRRSSSLGSRLTELVRLNYKKLLKKCYFVFKNLTRVYDLVDIECFNF